MQLTANAIWDYAQSKGIKLKRMDPHYCAVGVIAHANNTNFLEIYENPSLFEYNNHQLFAIERGFENCPYPNPNEEESHYMEVGRELARRAGYEN